MLWLNVYMGNIDWGMTGLNTMLNLRVELPGSPRYRIHVGT